MSSNNYRTRTSTSQDSVKHSVKHSVKRSVSNWIHKKQLQTSDLNIFKNIYKNPNERKQHESFMRFCELQLSILSTDLDNYKDKIITIKNFKNNENDKDYLLYLKQIYEDNYISNLSEKNPKNKNGYKYPYFSKDLQEKNYIAYKQYEEEQSIAIPIENQNEEQFFESLNQRVSGLEKCSKDPLESIPRKKYYSREHDIENKQMQILSSNTDSFEDKIKEQCKIINWNDDEIKYFDYKDFTLFLNNNNELELKFAKTFLPDECFNSDGKINIDSLKQFITLNNNNFRQYIFGFDYSILGYKKYKPFFEARSMMTSLDGTYLCDKFVNWNIMMNLIYNRCAMSNSEIFCPIRFILPNKDIFYIDPNDKDKGIKIRYSKQINYLFDTSKIEFVGILVIKNVNDHNHNNKKLMIKFIFKNKTKQNWDTIDTIKGIIPQYFIVNERMRVINEGSIITHPNATFSELRNFMNMSQQSKITIYGSELDINVLFISNNNYKDIDKKTKIIEDLKLFEIEISEEEYEYFAFRKKIMSGGYININNNKNFKIKLQTTTNENILYKPNNNICGNSYNSFLNKVDTTIGIDFTKESLYVKKYEISTQILYDYLLIANDEIKLSSPLLNRLNKNLIITKYIPLSPKFHYYTEIFNKYNIKITNNQELLLIGYYLTPIEFIKFHNYKINNINVILPIVGIDAVKIINQWNEYINIVKGIYNIKITEYLDILYKLPILQIDNITKKNDLVIYNIYYYDKYLYLYETYLNIPNIFIGALIGLKYTSLNGTFILNFGSIAYKHLADIYLILSQYFEEHYLYYPEISNLFKRTGTQGIFKGYKGINDTEYNKLIDILKSIEKIYPNGSKDFNIYDPEIRKQFNILSPINSELEKIHKHIIGFLDYKPSDQIYDKIRQFNNERYLKQDIYMSKLLKYINMPLKDLESIKVPSNEQITNAILYCRKYDIPIFNNYSKKKQNNLITKTILTDMYGLHEPILYKFKSNIIKKNSLIKLSKESKASKASKASKNSFFNNLFSNSSFKKTKKVSKKTDKSTSKSQLKYKSNISLEEAVFNSNNQLFQVGYLMDVRKDFSKVNPNEIYNMLKEQFRYYKASNPRKVPNLDTKVQNLLGDFSVSQAWLKMYEILSECNIIPTNRKGVYKSFHICEAPGTFINCINNFIHSKTQYDSYEWKAQSLKPSGKRGDKTISDQFGLIKRHPERWDWGVDNTGDITNTENIRHYAKIAKSMNINLMTSDCGLPMGDPKFLHVEFASYVSILYSLPLNGTLLYKILSPIDVPLLWNLIYITYKNFKEMYFFKPVQNSQSREFYIIGKGYLGTEQKVLDKLLNLVDKFDKFDKLNFNKEEYDLYDDMYPEEFVIQVQTICERLASNYVNSIERIIYYTDNVDSLGKDYQKHIESYVSEKNEDWIRKYKPRRIDNKWIL